MNLYPSIVFNRFFRWDSNKLFSFREMVQRIQILESAPHTTSHTRLNSFILDDGSHFGGGGGGR